MASTYVVNVTRRIVRMFERYAENTDPSDEKFLGFVSDFLVENGVKNAEDVPYAELYLLIQKAIRNFLSK
ncbi:MAG: hypothetical protein ACLPY5_08340 [Candidatus Bathyarchaeia archaeon]